jgi:AraC-like DNA-binding protein
VGFGKYIKTAFTNRWNLLWFGGAAAFALLTPVPDVVLAIVSAVEITYLGLLGTHPKFQAYVDAQQSKQARAATSVSTQQTLERITKSLPKELLDRFSALKARCLELQQIAAEFDLSVSHFSRAFRVSTGLPPHQWLLRQRVETAKQLMTVRDLPLSEIAISAGFANQSHLTKVFSAQVGVSPALWRREAFGARKATLDGTSAARCRCFNACAAASRSVFRRSAS